jgi:hypothetical protein
MDGSTPTKNETASKKRPEAPLQITAIRCKEFVTVPNKGSGQTVNADQFTKLRLDWDRRVVLIETANEPDVMVVPFESVAFFSARRREPAEPGQ